MKLKNFFVPVTALILFACNTASVNEQTNSTASTQRFSIDDRGSYKIIYVFASKNSSDTTYKYVLYHRGTLKPEFGFEAQFIETPAERVACLSNVFAGCMQKLGLEDKVIAVDNIDYICNEKIRKNFDEGKVKELAKHDELNIEATVLLKPQLIFTFGNGNTNETVSPRLKQSDIAIVVGADQFETTPLGRASWLKFVAAFFEKEQLADSILQQTNSKYDSLLQLTSGIKQKPTVVTEIKYSDTWYVPGGKSFIARMLEDAGSEYIWKNDTNSGSLALAYEDVFVKAAEADFWLNVHGWDKLDDCIKQDERNKNFKAYKNSSIFNNDALNNGRGGNAYWETGLISPDEVLADLIHIFHPDLLPEHRLKYYRKLN